MSDDVIIISSGDESEYKKEIKIEADENEKCLKEVHGSKRKLVAVESMPLKKSKIKLSEINDKSSKTESQSSEEEEEEMHKVAFREFVECCLSLDNSSNMKKIIEKKLVKYYSLLIPEYRLSDQFITFLERKKAEMERSRSHLFVHLKEVVDELNSKRSDKRKSKQIKKLNKAMELILKSIKKLEEKEVDWEEEEDSSYIQLQRYRERLIKVHQKIKELEGCSSRYHKRISFSGTQFPKVNKAIEKFINKKFEFPDYKDIYDLLKISYENENIEIKTSELKIEAKRVFQTIGDQLQKIRKVECWESVQWFLENDNDPADENEHLKTILENNKKNFQAQIDEVIDTFVKKSVRPQFASEDSNSSESVKKGDKSLHAHNQENNESKIKGNDENVETDEESNDDGVDGHGNSDGEDEDTDRDGENENAESVEDILNDLINREKEENTSAKSGPVSPPTTYCDSSNSENISDEEKNNCDSEHLEQNVAYKSFPGCSNWETDSQRKANIIKVRSISSLQRKVNVYEEILLD